MLRDHFFTIKTCEKTERSGTIEMEINETHEVFRGHFPDQPVVPGAFTLQMVKECAQHLLDRVFEYEEIRNSKFSSLIIPEKGRVIRAEMDFENLSDSRKIGIRASVKAGETTCLTLKAILKDVE